MNSFKVLEGDLDKWFGELSKEIKIVLERTSSITKAALPVVQEISAIVGVLPPGLIPAATFTKLTGYLATAVKDAVAVQAFTSQYENAPADVVLHALAALVIKNLPAGAKATASDIDTAVQNAYSVAKVIAATAEVSK